MTDRILLHDMVFQARHGVHEHERRDEQPFHVDVEMELDLRPAGRADDLELTVDYSAVYSTVRRIVESTSFGLIEALAEAIARELLAAHPVAAVRVRIRKPRVDLGGPLAYAAVEVERRRTR
jgi:dihydroneopterin aldolase